MHHQIYSGDRINILPLVVAFESPSYPEGVIAYGLPLAKESERTDGNFTPFAFTEGYRKLKIRPPLRLWRRTCTPIPQRGELPLVIRWRKGYVRRLYPFGVREPTFGSGEGVKGKGVRKDYLNEVRVISPLRLNRR